MEVEFIRDTGVYKKGEVVNASDGDGAEAITLGYAREAHKEKFYRDKGVLERIPKVDDKGTAVGILGVSPENYDEIKGNIVEEHKRKARMFVDKITIAEEFIDSCPIYYDDVGLYWLWCEGTKSWNMTDEVSVCNLMYSLIGINTVESKERNEMLQALKQASRMHRPSPFKSSWIQFKDTILDIKTGETFPASKDYFCVNPIGYGFHKEHYIETPTMDRIFKEWVGEENIKTLYEIIAYCCLPDYPIHRLFCFIGSGMNGKSCYLRLVENFVGKKNCCSTELDTLLSSRFEVTRLYKKLVCMMGETNFNEMSKTSILKKLTGQDTIGFEYKNKTPFEDKNYAKILISTNNLPETTDKTLGFYRR